VPISVKVGQKERSIYMKTYMRFWASRSLCAESPAILATMVSLVTMVTLVKVEGQIPANEPE
jgi:hypothetical protein